MHPGYGMQYVCRPGDSVQVQALYSLHTELESRRVYPAAARYIVHDNSSYTPNYAVNSHTYRFASKCQVLNRHVQT